MTEQNIKGLLEFDYEKLLAGKSEIRLQIEIGRRYSQIESDFRELRKLTDEAKLAAEGEDGFLSEQLQEDGSYLFIPSDERRAKESVYHLLDYASERLDELKLARYDLSHLIYLEMSFESLQRIVREELKNSRVATLNNIFMSAHFIGENIDGLRRSLESVGNE